MVTHITLAQPVFGIQFPLFGVEADGSPKNLPFAGHGVTMFFVLSGFLITFLLLKEAGTGTINIKKFYVRRAFRIWPIYYLVLLVSSGVLWKATGTIDVPTFLYYFFFASNIPFILTTMQAGVEHFWSIGVEEQFYLFWPWIVKYFRRRLVLLLVILITLEVILRAATWYFFPFSVTAFLLLVNRFDCMMLGALGAVLYHAKSRLIRLLDNVPAQIAAYAVIIILAANFRFINTIIDGSIVAAATLIIIVGQINIKNRVINLENRPMNFLGVISYGLYVYHPGVIKVLEALFPYLQIQNNTTKIFVLYVAASSLSILIAYISYRFFEKRFLDIKKRYMVVKSSNREGVVT